MNVPAVDNNGFLSLSLSETTEVGPAEKGCYSTVTCSLGRLATHTRVGNNRKQAFIGEEEGHLG